MKRHLYIIIYVVATLFTMPAFAIVDNDTTSILATLHSETLQATKGARPQSLKECLEKGLNKNYSLRIIRNKEQMSANNATLENAGMLPSVSLSAGYNGSAYGRNTVSSTGSTAQDRGVYDDGVNAGCAQVSG